jgi:hypothetical protein
VDEVDTKPGADSEDDIEVKVEEDDAIGLDEEPQVEPVESSNIKTESTSRSTRSKNKGKGKR